MTRDDKIAQWIQWWHNSKTPHLRVNTAIEFNLAIPAQLLVETHPRWMTVMPTQSDVVLFLSSIVVLTPNGENFGGSDTIALSEWYTLIFDKRAAQDRYYTGFWTEYCGVDLPVLGRDGPIGRWRIWRRTFQLRGIRYRLLSNQDIPWPLWHMTLHYRVHGGQVIRSQTHPPLAILL
jgi:hypothetical protein